MPRLHTKKALSEGKLFTDARIEGNTVNLVLSADYNAPSQYRAIKDTLYHLYLTSASFQEKFEQPSTSIKNAPSLTLKEGHGYVRPEDILNALQRFAAPKKALNAQHALAAGALFTAAHIEGNTVNLVLSAGYNAPSQYDAINKSLHHLYSTSPSFQEKFEPPSTSIKNAPSLTLKEGHGYERPEDILNALQRFAAPKKALNAQHALAAGALFTAAHIEGNTVNLVLSAGYNAPSQYDAINKSLHHLYSTSPSFQEKFEPPSKSRKNAPSLTLKEGHGYERSEDILNALKGFATPKKPKKALNAKRALAAGALFTAAHIEGNTVNLVLSVDYKAPSQHDAIKKALYHLYRASPSFQEKFEPPNQSKKNAPSLTLKKGHGYQRPKDILNALKRFAAPEKSKKVAALNAKRALAQGGLFIAAHIDENTVNLVLSADYNAPSQYRAINEALHRLYLTSPSFQEKFERPSTSRKNAPSLTLKNGHGYVRPEDILNTLKGFAAPKKPLDTKCALAQGELFIEAHINGNTVNLVLNAEYNTPSQYCAIKQALYRLYLISDSFQEKFEQPSLSKKNAPSLTLKEGHGYERPEDILKALKSFAETKNEKAKDLIEKEDASDDETLSSPDLDSKPMVENKDSSLLPAVDDLANLNPSGSLQPFPPAHVLLEPFPPVSDRTNDLEILASSEFDELLNSYFNPPSESQAQMTESVLISLEPQYRSENFLSSANYFTPKFKALNSTANPANAVASIYCSPSLPSLTSAALPEASSVRQRRQT